MVQGLIWWDHILWSSPIWLWGKLKNGSGGHYFIRDQRFGKIRNDWFGERAAGNVGEDEEEKNKGAKALVQS